MRILERTPLRAPVFCRVKVPVRGITEGEREAAMFPRGTLVLSQDQCIRAPVPCYVKDYYVLKQDFTQKCKRVVRSQRAGAADLVIRRPWQS